MTLDDLIGHYGTITRIAATLADTPWPATKQAIGQWKNRVPEGRQIQFEMLTNGALKAEKPAAA